MTYSEASSAKAKKQVIVVGGGFSGLSTAYELSRRGIEVTVFEKDEDIGGLARGFTIHNATVERFYHHWFTGDTAALELVKELGAGDDLLYHDSRTGLFYQNRIYRLSTPWDLLRFNPLSFRERLRLGHFTLKVRKIRDWKYLEQITALEWLTHELGKNIVRIVWEPLLRGKFGKYADQVAAVWIWNKLKLRGSSRDSGGKEQLIYPRGGFPAVISLLRDKIKANGGRILTSMPVTALEVHDDTVAGVHCGSKLFPADHVVLATSLPVAADLLAQHVDGATNAQLRSIPHLADICLVLELDHNLSDTYWLNVNEPGFPFVGVIEHTNFESPSTFGGRHICYLSSYLPEDDPLFSLNSQEFLTYALPYLKRIFPRFQDSWIKETYLWRTRDAQPVVTKDYSKLLPPVQGILGNLSLNTMAQIYPEDRGTNYAIREGRALGEKLAHTLQKDLRQTERV